MHTKHRISVETLTRQKIKVEKKNARRKTTSHNICDPRLVEIQFSSARSTKFTRTANILSLNTFQLAPIWPAWLRRKAFIWDRLPPSSAVYFVYRTVLGAFRSRSVPTAAMHFLALLRRPVHPSNLITLSLRVCRKSNTLEVVCWSFNVYRGIKWLFFF